MTYYLFHVNASIIVNANSMSFALYSSISCFGTQLAHNFLAQVLSDSFVQQGAGNLW